MNYYNHKLNQAKQTREIYGMVGFPSISEFKNTIKNNIFKNSPSTLEGIKISLYVYGSNITDLKGKTARTKPLKVELDTIKIL